MFVTLIPRNSEFEAGPVEQRFLGVVSNGSFARHNFPTHSDLLLCGRHIIRPYVNPNANYIHA